MCSYSEIESLIFHVTCNLQMNQPDFWKPLARRGTLFSSFYWSISLRRSNISHLPSYRIFQAISGDKNLLINLQVTLLRMLAAVVLRCLSSHSSIHRVYSAAPRYLRWTSSGRDNTQTRKYTRTHTRTGPFCERCTFVLTVTSSEGQTPTWSRWLIAHDQSGTALEFLRSAVEDRYLHSAGRRGLVSSAQGWFSIFISSLISTDTDAQKKTAP